MTLISKCYGGKGTYYVKPEENNSKHPINKNEIYTTQVLQHVRTMKSRFHDSEVNLFGQTHLCARLCPRDYEHKQA